MNVNLIICISTYIIIQFNAPYTTYLTSTHFIAAEIVSVQPNYVDILRNGAFEAIPYDFLVVALGTKYRNILLFIIVHLTQLRYPLFKAEAPTLTARADELISFAQQVRTASHVLVVGGREVGVEFLGEVMT